MPKDDKPGWKSQEDRDLAVRRYPRAPTPRPDRDTDETRAEMQRERDAVSSGAIEIYASDENTGITQRIADDPDMSRLFHKIERLKVRVIDEFKSTADKLLETHGEGAHGERITEIEKMIDPMRVDIATIKSSLGIGKWVLGFVIAASLASIGIVVSTVWGRGENAGEQTIRIQHLERDLDSLRREIEARHGRADAPMVNQNSSQSTPKGNTP